MARRSSVLRSTRSASVPCSLKLRQYVFRAAINETTIKQSIVEGFITGGLFELPAGSVDLAVGYLFKRDEYSFLPDSSLTADRSSTRSRAPRVPTSSASTRRTLVRGETISREVYLEALVPILSNITAIEQLDLTVGYRYANHSVAEEMNSYKAEFTWDITSQFGARAGYQRAVRAPNINELFRPATINFPSVGLGDPCSNNFPSDGNVLGAQDDQGARALCVAQGIPDAALSIRSVFTNTQFQGLSGGNPTLQEETADTITAGLVWRGDGDGFFGNFSGSIDFYRDRDRGRDRLYRRADLRRALLHAGFQPVLLERQPVLSVVRA